MRNAFVRELTQIATDDRNTILITGDLGFGVLTDFAKQFPKQYINAGVAEQNMTALAVGLALEGKTVFTYSIANFPTLRCLEQIRNDACYHSANVKIVSVGGGFAYGPLGISHHATEDMAIMRSLPNMTVFAPGDPKEVILVTREAYQTAGTCYLRLGRGGELPVHSSLPELKGNACIELVREGEIALLSSGGILGEVMTAREKLQKLGTKVSVYSFPVLKPIDAVTIRHLARSMKLIVSIEEHTILGGLGGAVGELIAEEPGRTAKLLRIGLNDQFSSIVGTQEYLRTRYGLDAEAIAKTVQAQL